MSSIPKVVLIGVGHLGKWYATKYSALVDMLALLVSATRHYKTGASLVTTFDLARGALDSGMIDD